MAYTTHTGLFDGSCPPTVSEGAWQPVSLPYAKPPHLLPTHWPTPQDIRNSKAIITERTGQTVVAVTPEILVKYGQNSAAREGQTLLFLEQCIPSVPAPRLYAMYHDDGDLFIVMQRFPGRSLDTVWEELSETDKDGLTARLREVFADMRSASWPEPSFFGAVDGGAVPYHLFYSAPLDASISGPFLGEQAFNSGLIQQYKQITDSNQHSSAKQDFYAAYLGQIFQGHDSVFTHSDVQRKNIVLAGRTGAEGAYFDGCELYIVDWEDAGWYPEYWEYAVAFSGWRWDDDWCKRFSEFLPAWPAESATLKMLYADIFL